MIPVLEFINNRKAAIKIAHRGGMALYPENTLEAFHGSVDFHKVEMLEMDLQITKDDQVIVLHDDCVDRTTNGTGKAIDLSYEEISEFDAGYNFKDEKGNLSFRDKGVKIPLFEEVLKQLPNTYLNIELKGNNPTLVQKTVPLITNYNAEDKILIGSANYFQNKRVQRHFPNCGYYLSRLELYLFIFRGYFGLLKRDGDKFLTVEAPIEHHGIPVYQTFLKATNKLGKPLFVWGANDKDTIQKLIAELKKSDSRLMDNLELLLMSREISSQSTIDKSNSFGSFSNLSKSNIFCPDKIEQFG